MTTTMLVILVLVLIWIGLGDPRGRRMVSIEGPSGARRSAADNGSQGAESGMRTRT